MERPKRQLKHLEEKLATKAARRAASGADKTTRPAGKKEKRWKKSAELYRPLVSGGENAG
jgi:hypothetical protein